MDVLLARQQHRQRSPPGNPAPSCSPRPLAAGPVRAAAAAAPSLHGGTTAAAPAAASGLQGPDAGVGGSGSGTREASPG